MLEVQSADRVCVCVELSFLSFLLLAADEARRGERWVTGCKGHSLDSGEIESKAERYGHVSVAG